MTMNQDVLLHPGADPRCPICLGLGIDVVRDQGWSVARTCSCVGRCPVCKDAGWIAEGDSFRAPRRRCDCRRVEARKRLFDELRLPGRYANATLASFEAGKQTIPAFVSANAYVQSYRPREDNRGLIFHGQVGRGKTHLMIGVLRELVLRFGISARFIEFSHLLGDLKASFDRRKGGAADLLEPLSRVEVLAVDELGKGRNTEFEGTILDELVSRRYNAAGTVLATTNYEPGSSTGHAVPGSLASAVSDLPALVDRVGDRVYSRLRETCTFVNVKGEDYRELKRVRTRRPR